jgi:ABC-type multidrug transport system fused ATPase/permease subunit
MDMLLINLAVSFIVVSFLLFILIIIPSSKTHSKLNVEYGIKKEELSVSEILGYWNIQESLLQTYRRYSFTIQAIFFSGAFATIKIEPENFSRIETLILIGLLFTASLAVFLTMNEVITIRGLLVRYWQDILRHYEQGNFDKIPKQPFTIMRDLETSFDVIDILENDAFKYNIYTSTKTRQSISTTMTFFAFLFPWVFVITTVYFSYY